MKKQKAIAVPTSDPLLAELRQLIDAARQRVATAANTELTMLYWRVGVRIRTEILNNERAEYGEQIVSTVSRQLTTAYGKCFDRPNLFRMVQFAEQFSDEQIVVTLSRQLSWSHFLAILPVKEDLARQFYAEMCRLERLPHEDAPLGLILCAEAGAEQVELLQLDQGSIRVAQYLTELPPLHLLQAKLREARQMAQERLLAEAQETEG